MENQRCFLCKNYFSDLRCQAFPEGIPEEILIDENDHSKPLPEQDNDIVFESLEENGT